jgi:hypothetical protein
MADHRSMRLGKLRARHDPRVPRLSRYVAGFPPPPPAAAWSGKLAAIGTMANDRLGDCTAAAVGHAIQVWSSQAKAAEATISDADVVALYSRFGYDPARPETDQGAVEIDVLSSWLAAPVAGHAISGFATLEPSNSIEIRDAIWLFGLVYIGLALPISAQSQDVWDVSPGGAAGSGEPGSWGGHAVIIVDYDERGLTCVTWGQLKRMSWQFWSTYCDEAYAILSPDWENAAAAAPSGFSWDQLAADMAALRGGEGPPKAAALSDRQLMMLLDLIDDHVAGLSADADAGTIADADAAAAPWSALAATLGAFGGRR